MALIRRHFSAAWYVLTVILPVLLRTGRRPVIFSRFAGMGDIIATFPVALELKKRHAGAAFIFNCAASFAGLPAMGGVTPHTTSFKDLGTVGHWYGFLLGGYYHFSYGDEFSHSASTEITIKEFGRPFGVEVSGEHPRLAVDENALARVKTRLSQMGCPPDNLILIHPGPSWPVRTWPHASWQRLLAGLEQKGWNNIIQMGAGVGTYTNVGAEDFPAFSGIKSLVDQLTLVETIALISQARLFIGIDSGLLHFAACLRVPAVGIFGATTPGLRFAPAYAQTFVTSQVACQGCHHRLPRIHWEKGCQYDIRCMQQLSSETVEQACLAVMTGRRA